MSTTGSAIFFLLVNDNLATIWKSPILASLHSCLFFSSNFYHDSERRSGPSKFMDMVASWIHLRETACGVSGFPTKSTGMTMNFIAEDIRVRWFFYKIHFFFFFSHWINLCFLYAFLCLLNFLLDSQKFHTFLQSHFWETRQFNAGEKKTKKKTKTTRYT